MEVNSGRSDDRTDEALFRSGLHNSAGRSDESAPGRLGGGLAVVMLVGNSHQRPVTSSGVCRLRRPNPAIAPLASSTPVRPRWMTNRLRAEKSYICVWLLGIHSMTYK